MTRSGFSFIALLGGMVLLWGGAAYAQEPSPSAGAPARSREVDPQRLAAMCPNQFNQSFPVSGPAETTWRICWHEVASNQGLTNPNGLVIGPVYFRKSPSAPFVSILWDLRVSDYFVPYHAGTPRYYDLSGFNFQLTTVTANDCPASVGGTLVSAHVCKEVHDRGLMWKDASGVRRGQELVLWGSIDAANYRYIQEYTFRDDGTIIGRMGATGQNLPNDELQPHAHNAIWRINFSLGSGKNNVARLQHAENPADPSGKASDSETSVSAAQGFVWDARKHDALAVSNPSLKNARGDLSEYQLLPLVMGGGLTQHTEPFTQNDFWVTPYKSGQFAARQLPSYVASGPNVANTDIVLWYKASLHHHPRDEDGVYNASHNWVGTAHVMWTGFALVAHNFLDCSPFYQPCP
jgi:Cu2+-containing amine oxidase